MNELTGQFGGVSLSVDLSRRRTHALGRSPMRTCLRLTREVRGVTDADRAENWRVYQEWYGESESEVKKCTMARVYP